MIGITSTRLTPLTLVLAGVFASSCGNDPARPREEPNPTPIADFSLRDVNPNSKRYNELVSPRDYQNKISAWYFGHAT